MPDLLNLRGQLDAPTALLCATVVAVVVIFVVQAVVRARTNRLARRRAEAILKTHLSTAELGQLRRFGVLDIRSLHRPERVYQICAQSGRVLVQESGRWTMELCIRTARDLPGEEHVVAHKLMIQGAEQDYLARANVIWSRGQATVSGRTSRLD